MALNLPFKKPLSDLSNLQDKLDSEFLKAISLFASQRKKLGISLEDLSTKTKISRNVLIAIEKGWKKYLPETTYLRSMLKMIEFELDLESGSLNGLLEKKISNNSLSSFKINFINIDFLDSWLGSLLYLIFMFLSILALNSQQKYLLKMHSVSTEPVIMNETNIDNKYRSNSNK
tara:strand:- start:1516 stop:2037 length:522 start_codon:yes stop_codon:yes gene_type:complete